VIVDSHAHIWSADSRRFPWSPVDDVPIPPEAAPAERLVGELDGVGATGAVCIQPRVYGPDHAYLLEALGAYPDRLAGVCLIDPRSDSVIEEFASLQATGRFRGVRLIALELHDPGILIAPPMAPVWRAIAESRLVVGFLIEPWHLELVETAAERHPGTDLVVDHLARCRPDTPAPLVERLLGLARYPNIRVKASALGLLSDAPYPYEDLRGLLQRAVDAFGTERVLWGSDFPHVLGVGPYRDSVSALLALLPDLDDRARALISGENAARLYGMAS
jgi:L-fuconolactonase